MLADLPFWLKIWNKGVDIATGVATNTISVGIIALIAIWTWRWKRKRDLKHEEDKQRQQHAIAEELAAKKRAKDHLDRVSALRRELGPLADRFASAGSAGNAEQLQKAWDTWVAWLEASQLQYLQANRKILDSWAVYSGKFQFANSNQTVSQWAEKLTPQVRSTQLRPE